ncbi:histidine--tRNA ligase [Candidatus Saccharibacteria bacterium]|nr:histidine--tRNA ligase [Candidatus Saccharibacteria bacterium]
MAKNQFQKVRGMQDILPADQIAWQHIVQTFTEICEAAGLSRISTPILEDAQLFIRGVGEATEVVHKEMYTLTDRGKGVLALKPEGTAGVVRTYLENGMPSWPKPVGLFYIEPLFRYDRPQEGRYRQHHQLGVEIFGVDSPTADVHTIALANRFYTRLGLATSLQVNSIGSLEARKRYQEALRDYFKPHEPKLTDLAKKQLGSNPLRLLDSKEANMQELIEKAPQILDYLDKSSKEHFAAVLEALDDLGIGYDVNPRLVRGLDYYNQTVFEFKGTRQGSQDSLGGGGRYDGLVELLGGQPTPAVGFGLGLERIKLELEATGHKLEAQKPDVYVVYLGSEAQKAALTLSEKLLDDGLSVRIDLTTKTMKDQLARASKFEAKYALIIGETELKAKKAILKDLKTGNQEPVDVAKASEKLAVLLSS